MFAREFRVQNKEASAIRERKNIAEEAFVASTHFADSSTTPTVLKAVNRFKAAGAAAAARDGARGTVQALAKTALPPTWGAASRVLGQRLFAQEVAVGKVNEKCDAMKAQLDTVVALLQSQQSTT
eukprot:COSAG06_NODE_1649_length_8808_cov_14.990010_7_plen_125_part_00